jgi:hypothetical protein
VEYFSVKIDSKPRPCLRLLSHPFKGAHSSLASSTCRRHFLRSVNAFLVSVVLSATENRQG